MTRNIQDLIGVARGAYVQTTDPGAVGAGKLWINTSSGPPFPLQVRNTGNSAWQSVGLVAAVLVGGNAQGAVLALGTTDNYNVNLIVNTVVEATLAPTGLTVTNDITAGGNVQAVDINATGAYKVDGTQVVSNRGAAVADVASANAPTQTGAYVQADVQAIATLANELKTQLNAALARLRAHGLIA